MSSRAAAKRVAPVKRPPARRAPAKAAPAKTAKAAPAKTGLHAKVVKTKAPARKKSAAPKQAPARAAARPAAKPASRSATAQKPAPLVVHKSPLVVHKSAPVAMQRPSPAAVARPLAAAAAPRRPSPPPRPPVVAAVLSVPKGPPRQAPGAPVPPPPPRPQPKPQPTLARSYFFSDLREGDDLPPLAKPPVDRLQIARYAVEAHELNRLHLDEPYAVALGYRTIFAPGALAMGFVAQLVSQWLKRGLVRKLQARFVKIVRPGDELTCRGRIAELRREKGACLAELELWAENQKGELVLRGHATCELLDSPASMPGLGGLLSGAPRALASRRLRPLRKPAPLPKKK